MTTANFGYNTPATYTVASSLAATNYDTTASTSSISYNVTTNKPMDVRFEYAATVAANSTGNKQIVLYAQASLDGTTWPPGPTSATDTTHDTSMKPLGTIPTNGGASSESVRESFSIAAAFGGLLPAYWRVFVKNDCGVALSSCSARTQEIPLTAV